LWGFDLPTNDLIWTGPAVTIVYSVDATVFLLPRPPELVARPNPLGRDRVPPRLGQFGWKRRDSIDATSYLADIGHLLRPFHF
jgi:hypothetical protein